MDTNDEPALFDAFDIGILLAIGLATAAWFSRDKLKSLIMTEKPVTNTPVPVANPKRERNFVKVMKEQGRRVIVFYGSQTGTAEGYASSIAKECHQRFGVSCMTADLELYDLTYLDKVPKDFLVIFVMATYGEGDPTDNAIEFWDLITDEEPMFSEESHLANLHYVMFGLGNKTYEMYNEVSRRLNKRLQQLGAHLVGEAGEGDDDGSLEEDYLAWKERLWPFFCEFLGVEEGAGRLGPREAVYAVEELVNYNKEDIYLGELTEKPKSTTKIVYGAKRPYIAPITTRELFHSPDRHCLHIEIDLTDTNLKYTTGDHLAIWPTNPETEVNRLASALGLTDRLDTILNLTALDPTQTSPFPVPASYRAILRHYLEITKPISRQALGSFIEFATTDQAKARLSQLSSDKDQYRVEVSSRTLGEVLERLGMSVPFDVVIETLGRIQPRFYSISSSAKESPKVVSATVVTLSYQPDPERTVYGVNSHFLYRIHAGADAVLDLPQYDLAGPCQAFLVEGEPRKVPVHLRSSQFKLPRNPTVPVIMVGPGTGVAPFRGFVRERAFEKKAGKPVGTTLLFYGSRNAAKDFLYSDEWDGLFETLGGDSKIVTAFSRDQPQKIYVQHRLQEYSEMIWDLLQKGAYVYVCGDAKNMARDVNQTFINFAITLGGLSEQKAHSYVKSLRTIGRYQEDVWS